MEILREIGGLNAAERMSIASGQYFPLEDGFVTPESALDSAVDDYEIRKSLSALQGTNAGFQCSRLR